MKRFKILESAGAVEKTLGEGIEFSSGRISVELLDVPGPTHYSDLSHALDFLGACFERPFMLRYLDETKKGFKEVVRWRP